MDGVGESPAVEAGMPSEEEVKDDILPAHIFHEEGQLCLLWKAEDFLRSVGDEVKPHGDLAIVLVVIQVHKACFHRLEVPQSILTHSVSLARIARLWLGVSSHLSAVHHDLFDVVAHEEVVVHVGRVKLNPFFRNFYVHCVFADVDDLHQMVPHVLKEQLAWPSHQKPVL